jgi:O-antigen ligase/cytochrome c-type biogenesis protein CcmH/NrfG
MRLGRLAFIFLGIYLVFIGGSAYYTLIFPVRVFHHVLMTLLLAMWLFLRLRRGKGLPETPLNWPIFAAIAIWIITAITSIDPRMAFENLWFQLMHVVLFFVLVDLFQRGRGRLVMETQFMIAAAIVFLSGLELASWYLGLGILPGTQIGWVRFISAGILLPLYWRPLALAMNISTLLAGYVAPLVDLTSSWALTARRRDYRIALSILAGALLLVLLLTFSRGGLLSIFTAAGFFIAIRLTQTRTFTRILSTRVFIGLAAIIGAAGISAFVFLYVGRPDRRSGDLGRLDMWRSAVQMTQANPLTGVGPGLFGRAFRDYRNPTLIIDKHAAAHNAYLNTMAETGAMGVLVSLWLGFAFIQTWYRNWRSEPSHGHKIRLEAAFAALLGIGVHNLVDTFTITPIVLLILLLAAYCITSTDEMAVRPAQVQTRQSLAGAAFMLVAVLAYGVWFIQLDRAQSHYQRSLRGDSDALDEARAAAELDPALRLYPLQTAYLTGILAVKEPGQDVSPAITAYEKALSLEPTWDTGWINLAALELRQGDNGAAQSALEKARHINTSSTAGRIWAEMAEKANSAPRADIIHAYYVAMYFNGFAPLSAYWSATELRKAALEQYLTDSPVDWQYRILAVHDPQRAYKLVPAEPQTAAEWWVKGEYALTIQNDAQTALQAFSEAVKLDYINADYYVSRARAELTIDRAAAERDLNLAQLLGTTVGEYPNAVRAQLATTKEQVYRLRVDALPPRQFGQEFAAVLYGRTAGFDIFPEMQTIGPGRAAMQPWYAIAADRLANGQTTDAVNAYRAILDYAPDEQEARDQLQKLGG